MRVLALDTATSATLVALCDVPPATPVGAAAHVEAAAPQNTFEARDDPPAGVRPRHITRLLPLIEEVLAEADAAWTSVDLIAVGVGPGTFTGLRIGIATAQALARARGIPLTGVSTLSALALNAGPNGPLIAAVDARRGEAFAAGWRSGSRPPEPPEQPAAALGPDGLTALTGALGAPLAIGEGAIAFAPVLRDAGAEIPDPGDPIHRLTAISHCRLAPGGPAADPGAVHPDYLREPDAKPRQA